MSSKQENFSWSAVVILLILQRRKQALSHPAQPRFELRWTVLCFFTTEGMRTQRRLCIGGDFQGEREASSRTEKEYKQVP